MIMEEGMNLMRLWPRKRREPQGAMLIWRRWGKKTTGESIREKGTDLGFT